MADYAKQRDDMVRHQIEGRGVRSKLVLDAMRRVPRERFLPEGWAVFAYDDSPLPIGQGQTISQPYIVAFMTDALELEGGEKILEIGTGSGYAAAVLAEIAAEVFTIERIEGLADMARSVLESLGYDNVYVQHSDGTLGCPQQAPFDDIVVTAGAPAVPDSLQQQLKIGGHLVIPVGKSHSFQQLLRITRTGENDFEREQLLPVRFVPLVGEQGWSSERKSFGGGGSPGR
jgi:protein-L-isoaspartate(D-aspartate) O-methyltransferase